MLERMLSDPRAPVGWPCLAKGMSITVKSLLQYVHMLVCFASALSMDVYVVCGHSPGGIKQPLHAYLVFC